MINSHVIHDNSWVFLSHSHNDYEKVIQVQNDSNSQVKLKGNKYYVSEGKKRYLWLATRMGMPTVKDAPGIEIVQTYNLLTHDQIEGMVLKTLV